MTSRQRIDNSRDPLLRYGSQSTASSDTNGSGNVHKNTTFKDRINSIQFASISLENKGSVARDHMANERTFLAWLRTSLSFITIGIGITQLFRLEDKSSKVLINRFFVELDDNSHVITDYGRPLGCLFIILGILTLLFGVIRYFKVQHMLVKNYYPATRLSILILISLLLAVVISTFVMVIKSFV